MHTRNALKLLFTSLALPLFVGAALSDWAYKTSYHIQWMNFSSWLIIGAMVFAILAILTVLAAGGVRNAASASRWLTFTIWRVVPKR